MLLLLACFDRGPTSDHSADLDGRCIVTTALGPAMSRL